MRLLLASASPRRAELLAAAGLAFDTIVASVDESLNPGESPERYVRRLAAEKSAAVLRQLQGDASSAPGQRWSERVVLGADTSVVVDHHILGKPADAVDAGRMLRLLAGRTHEVLTGISLRQGAYEVGRVERTTVEFGPLDASEIAWYVASGEGLDKAGGYAIQGLASRFVTRIDGSYANVVGLPVAAVYDLIKELTGGAGRLME